MSKKWTADVKYDNDSGDTYIELPDDLMKEAGWNLGDDIEWIDNHDGTWTMKKVEKSDEKEWVLVECIQQYRLRYMCEVPKGQAGWALDTVAMKEAKEFSQKDLGEIESQIMMMATTKRAKVTTIKPIKKESNLIALVKLLLIWSSLPVN